MSRLVHHVRTLGLVALPLALVLACAGSQKPPPAPEPVARGPSPIAQRAVDRRLQGDWTTSLEGDGLIGHERIPLTLHVSGTHVIGHLGVDGGEIDGQIVGDEVVGSWKELDGEGSFRWELSPDDRSFRGTFTGMLHSQKVPEGSRWTGVHESNPAGGVGGGPPAASSSWRPPWSSDPLVP